MFFTRKFKFHVKINMKMTIQDISELSHASPFILGLFRYNFIIAMNIVLV